MRSPGQLLVNVNSARRLSIRRMHCRNKALTQHHLNISLVIGLGLKRTTTISLVALRFRCRSLRDLVAFDIVGTLGASGGAGSAMYIGRVTNCEDRSYHAPRCLELGEAVGLRRRDDEVIPLWEDS